MIDEEPEWTWWNKFSDNQRWYKELPCGCVRNVQDIFSLRRWKCYLDRPCDEIHKLYSEEGMYVKREVCGVKIGKPCKAYTYICEECCQRFTLIHERTHKQERVIKNEDVVFERE